MTPEQEAEYERNPYLGIMHSEENRTMVDQPQVVPGSVEYEDRLDQQWLKLKQQANSMLTELIGEQRKTNKLLELLLSNSNETLAVTNWHKQESRRMMEKVAGLDTSVDDTPVGPA